MNTRGGWRRLQAWFNDGIARAMDFLTPKSKRDRNARERTAEFRAMIKLHEDYLNKQQRVAGATTSPYPAQERLARALRQEVAQLSGEKCFQPGINSDADEIIYHALRGEYGMYPSVGLAISKRDLYQDCISAGLTAFAQRVARGEFNTTPAEQEVSNKHIEKTVKEEALKRQFEEAHRWDIRKHEWWKPKP